MTLVRGGHQRQSELDGSTHPPYNGRMGILIDGYNLLNATGVEGTGRGTELARARRGLLAFLADVLSDDEQANTTIVFDAQGAPPGLPREQIFGGMTVLFARGYAEADDLLEKLIAEDHAPRQLTVVSSDHRLHRAARRRKATAMDSQMWIAQLESRSGKSRDRSSPKKPPPEREQTESWLAEFSDVDVQAIEQEVQSEFGARGPDDARGAGLNELDPFPPDFGKDLPDDGL